MYFSTETDQGVAKAILRAVIDFKRDPWPKVSDDAKDLVKRMLDSDPKGRLTAQEALGNDYFECSFCVPFFLGFLVANRYEDIKPNFLLGCRTPLVARCQESSKCPTWRDCKSKAEAIFCNEQAKKESSNGDC